MYKILKSTPNGIDELELEQLEKGCWIDIVSPSPEELHEIAAATKIQLDFLTAALDEEEKSRIETEDDQILILVDIPFLRSNKDYDTLPLGIIIAEDFIVTVCLALVPRQSNRAFPVWFSYSRSQVSYSRRSAFCYRSFAFPC